MGNIKEAHLERSRFWRELLATQKQSGQPVRAFCKEKSVSEPSFYYWRQRFGRVDKPVGFALVETARVGHPPKGEPVELTLISGDQLRITPGTDVATLRMVLTVLREPRR